MPYGLLILVFCIGLTCHYVAVAKATARSKSIIGFMTFGSLLIAWLSPRWSLLALVLQIAVSAYVLLCYRIDGLWGSAAGSGKSDRRSYYGDERDSDDAVAKYSEAIRLNPQDPIAYLNRGLAYSEQGDKAKAEVDFAQAKKLGYKPS
ncbi:MAG: tetratricopeptide repeat protein [Thermoguttaceae bacterium]|jgi:tetratricopeptide (TPR) repeat protein